MKRAEERLFLGSGAEAAPPLVQGGGTYLEHAPPPSLRASVVGIATYREGVAPGRTVEELVLPDGAVRLIFHLGSRPADDGPPAVAAGASREAAVVRMAGAVDGVSVQLRAGGAVPLLGIPAGEIAGRAVPLDDLWGARAAETRARMAEAADERERVAAVQRALRERLAGQRVEPHAGVARAVDLIVASAGRLRPGEVAAAIGVGQRRLEQLFHLHVGLTPKTVCRLVRFRAVVRLLRRRPDLPWPGLAHEFGLYDQSHLVHEFRRVAGLTPTGLLERIVSDSSKTDA